MIQNILIVDDSATDRNFLEQLLRKAGYGVSTALNGSLALQQVQQSRPDAILMDVNMPEMDGFAATRKLKSDERTKSIPVYFVTGKNQKADMAWAQMLGARGYVTKPYSEAQILELFKG
ncbi:MAG: two-component system response regulator [Betaproteobacteria bacterium HGW-Betaproteobacteria-3]|jgi:twitching motility two-component system response regulator PilH|nr:MAG: two-component system response regulator [Betaproteobacteria bacterium HGW-Betaproteobacteria-3]